MYKDREMREDGWGRKIMGEGYELRGIREGWKEGRP